MDRKSRARRVRTNFLPSGPKLDWRKFKNRVPFQIAPDFRPKTCPKITVRAIVRFFAPLFSSFTAISDLTVRPERGKLILASPRDDRRAPIVDLRDRFCDHLLSRKCVDWGRFAQGSQKRDLAKTYLGYTFRSQKKPDSREIASKSSFWVHRVRVYCGPQIVQITGNVRKKLSNSARPCRTHPTTPKNTVGLVSPIYNRCHLSCLNSRHLSCLNRRHLSCLTRRHNSSRPEAGSCRVFC